MDETENILLEKVKEKGVVKIIIDYKNDLESVNYFIIQLIDSIIREITEFNINN